MPIVYSTTVKNARLQAVVDALGEAGTIVIGTAALAGGTGRLALVPMDDTSFTITNGVMTLNNVPRTVVAIATGIAAKAEFRASDGTTVVVSGLTVGTSEADIIINATAISTGQTVQVTAGTITHG